MKIDAISTHEASTIIQHLNLRGKWRAVRMGATVELARIKTPSGGAIYYTVTISRNILVSARAATVAEAVADCNEVIRAHELKPLAGRRAGHHQCTETPGLVRAAARRAVESGGLWEGM